MFGSVILQLADRFDYLRQPLVRQRKTIGSDCEGLMRYVTRLLLIVEDRYGMRKYGDVKDDAQLLQPVGVLVAVDQDPITGVQRRLQLG